MLLILLPPTPFLALNSLVEPIKLNFVSVHNGLGFATFFVLRSLAKKLLNSVTTLPSITYLYTSRFSLPSHLICQNCNLKVRLQSSYCCQIWRGKGSTTEIQPKFCNSDLLHLSELITQCMHFALSDLFNDNYMYIYFPCPGQTTLSDYMARTV